MSVITCVSRLELSASRSEPGSPEPSPPKSSQTYSISASPPSRTTRASQAAPAATTPHCVLGSSEGGSPVSFREFPEVLGEHEDADTDRDVLQSEPDTDGCEPIAKEDRDQKEHDIGSARDECEPHRGAPIPQGDDQRQHHADDVDPEQDEEIPRVVREVLHARRGVSVCEIRLIPGGDHDEVVQAHRHEKCGDDDDQPQVPWAGLSWWRAHEWPSSPDGEPSTLLITSAYSAGSTSAMPRSTSAISSRESPGPRPNMSRTSFGITICDFGPSRTVLIHLPSGRASGPMH